jgi:inner membrane protein
LSRSSSYEVFSSRRLHPLHYLLVGLANCLSYLLLLSLSEHIAFDPAYAIACAASSGLITCYTIAVMLFTRNVNWYGMGFQQPRAERPDTGD